jgi:hypothetical protein
MKFLWLLTLLLPFAASAEAIDQDYLSKQKIILENRDYDHFFGRTLFLISNTRENNAIRWENEILSMLAFTQLCYFEQADHIANTLKQKILSPKLIRKIELAKEYNELKRELELKTNFNKKKATNPGSTTYNWPIQTSIIKQLSSSKNLRLRVKSECNS